MKYILKLILIIGTLRGVLMQSTESTTLNVFQTTLSFGSTASSNPTSSQSPSILTQGTFLSSVPFSSSSDSTFLSIANTNPSSISLSSSLSSASISSNTNPSSMPLSSSLSSSSISSNTNPSSIPLSSSLSSSSISSNTNPSSMLLSSSLPSSTSSNTNPSSMPLSSSLPSSISSIIPGLILSSSTTSSDSSTTSSNTPISNVPSSDSSTSIISVTSTTLAPISSFISNKISTDSTITPSSDTTIFISSTSNSISSNSAPQSISNTNVGLTSQIVITPTSSSVSNTQTGYSTGLNLDTSSNLSPYWVVTGCEININENINIQYKTKMEQNLSRAYDEGYRLALLKSRVKRAATIGTNTLQLVDINRVTAGQSPSNLIYYVMTTSNNFVPPSTVISNMNQLSLQQLSLYLGVPVTAAAIYFDPVIQNPGYDQKLWIIGAVFGSLAGAAFIVWIVLFVFYKCIRPWDEPLIKRYSMDSESGTYTNDIENSNHIQNEVVIHPMVGILNDNSDKTKEKSKENFTRNEETNSIIEIVSNETKEFKKHDLTEQTPEHEIKKDKLKSSPSDKKSEKDKNEKKKKNKKKKDNSIQSDFEINNEPKIKKIEKSSPTKSGKDSLTSVEDDKSLVIAKMSELLQQNEMKNSINLIEVKPTVIPIDEMEFSEIIQPVPFVDNYSSLHIFPRYRDEDIVISDTSLNLVKYKASDELEKEKKELMERKSIKNNLRTFEPLPRKSRNVHPEMTSRQLVDTLKYEISEASKNNETS